MSDEIRISELGEQFIRYAAQRYSPPTVAAYSQALHIFYQHIRHEYRVNLLQLPLSRMELGWGESFLGWLQETRSVETEHLYMRVLYQFYEYASQNHITTYDVIELAQHIEEHRRPKTHIIPTLPFEAIQRVIQTATADHSSPAASEREMLGYLRDRAFILALASTGLRISEICELQMSQINSDAMHIELGDDMKLPLPSVVSSAIKNYLTKRASLDQQQPIQLRNNLPLFARHDKRVASRILPISRWTGANIVDWWVSIALTPEEQKTLKEANQVITPHTFRHNFVLTALMNTDHDLTTTQAMARHGDRSTTRRYLAKLADNPALHSD